MKSYNLSNSTAQILEEIAGKEAVALVEYIANKQNVSEFKIADKLKMTVNQVRNVLYKLNSYNLVSSTRKKDKKKGWYIYYWTYNNINAQAVIKSLRQKKIERLRKRIQDESNTSYFVCSNEGRRYSYESALENSFKCIECGELLKQEQGQKELLILKKKLAIFESEDLDNSKTTA